MLMMGGAELTKRVRGTSEEVVVVVKTFSQALPLLLLLLF